jgi:hypothetical protein
MHRIVIIIESIEGLYKVLCFRWSVFITLNFILFLRDFLELENIGQTRNIFHAILQISSKILE